MSALILSPILVVNKGEQSSSTPQFFDEPLLLVPSNRRSFKAQSKLQELRESGKELRCTCTIPAARMFIRYTHDYYTIVNHASQGEHSAKCELFSEVHGYSERGTSNPTVKDDQNLQEFHLHNKVRDTARSSEVTNTATGNVKNEVIREPKISKLYRYLTEKSFSNYHYRNKNLSELNALRKLVEPATKIKFGETILSSYLFYGKMGMTYAIQKLKNEISRGAYIGAGRPHALVAMTTTTLLIDKNYIQLDKDKYHYKNLITPKCRTSGAQLVIMSIAQCSIEPSEIEVHTVFAHPILKTNHLMPVDSQLERVVASFLIEKIDHSSSEQHRCTLFKPMYSLKVRSESSHVLPDFILKQKHVGTKRTTLIEVIEVMGMLSDSSYCARKKRLLPLMAEAYDANKVTQVDPASKQSMESFIEDHHWV